MIDKVTYGGTSDTTSLLEVKSDVSLLLAAVK
jgi:hypothetical protein